MTEFGIGTAILIASLIAFLWVAVSYGFRLLKNKSFFLALLRFFGVFVLAFTLLNPKFFFEKISTQKPILSLLVDNSASINHLGESERVRQLVNQFIEDQALNNRFEVRMFEFSEQLNALNATESLTFDQKKTNLIKPLEQLKESFKNYSSSATVLISDGNQNFGKSYLTQTLDADTFAVFPIVVGDTTQYEDLEISRVNHNKISFLNNEFPVEVFVNYSGKQNFETHLEISLDGITAQKIPVSISEEVASQRIEVLLKANQLGRRNYRLKVPVLNNELNTQNNTMDFSIDVQERQIKVLLVRNSPHPDISAIKQAVEANKQRTLSIDSPENISDLSDYTTLILFRPDARFKTIIEQAERLKINLWYVVDNTTELSFLNNYNTVFKQQPTGQSEEAQALLRSGFSYFATDNLDFSDYPPLITEFGTIEFLSNAQVLMHQSIDGIPTEKPLWAMYEAPDARRTAITFGTGLWRWRMHNYKEARNFEKINQLINSQIQFLSNTVKRKRLEVEVEEEYLLPDPISFDINYYDKNFELSTQAVINLKLTQIETKEERILPVIPETNFYRLQLDDLEPGNYNYTINVEDESDLTASGSFSVSAFNRELQRFNADYARMQQIAENYDAKVYDPTEVSAIKEQLLTDADFSPILKSTKKLQQLIDWRWLLLIAAFFFACEWFLRKYRGLV